MPAVGHHELRAVRRPIGRRFRHRCRRDLDGTRRAVRRHHVDVAGRDGVHLGERDPGSIGGPGRVEHLRARSERRQLRRGARDGVAYVDVPARQRRAGRRVLPGEGELGPVGAPGGRALVGGGLDRRGHRAAARIQRVDVVVARAVGRERDVAAHARRDRLRADGDAHQEEGGEQHSGHHGGRTTHLEVIGIEGANPYPVSCPT